MYVNNREANEFRKKVSQMENQQASNEKGKQALLNELEEERTKTRDALALLSARAKDWESEKTQSENERLKLNMVVMELQKEVWFRHT